MAARSMLPPLPPAQSLVGQVRVWVRALQTQHDRLMVVVGRKNVMSDEKTSFIYESVFYLEALRNLYRTIQRVNSQFREPQMGAAMKEFRKVVSEDRIKRMRGILNYQDEYTLGIGDAQKKNPHGDYEVWFQEDWDDETKTDFIVRVGEDFVMRISEVTAAAVLMADVVVRASFRSTPPNPRPAKPLATTSYARMTMLTLPVDPDPQQ